MTLVGAVLMTLTYKFSKGGGSAGPALTHPVVADVHTHMIPRVRARTLSKGPREAGMKRSEQQLETTYAHLGEQLTLYKRQCSSMLGHSAGVQNTGHAKRGQDTEDRSMPESR